MINLRSCQKEVFSLMRTHSKMLTVAPTSAGKSIMMIADADERIKNDSETTVVVVASKILLIQQQFLQLPQLLLLLLYFSLRLL